MKSRAILFTAPWEVRLGDVEVPEPVGSEVLIRAAITSVSPGTELRCLSGTQPGTEGWPFVPGYSHAGEVVAAGPDATVEVGSRVFSYGTEKVSATRMWGGHCEYAVRESASLHVLAENVPYEKAVFGHLAGIAYHGLRLSRPMPHDTVAVIGLGTIGQFSARLHALAGAHIVGFDANPKRVEMLRKAGVRAETVAGNLVEAVHVVFPGGPVVVVDATGHPDVLASTVECGHFPQWGEGSGPGTRFLVQGSYPGPISVPYQRAFERELHMLFPRDCVPSDIRRCLELIGRGEDLTSGMGNWIARPNEAPGVYASLRDPACAEVTCLIDWMRS